MMVVKTAIYTTVIEVTRGKIMDVQSITLAKFAEGYEGPWEPGMQLQPLMTAVDIMSKVLGTENYAIVDPAPMTPLTADLANELIDSIERICEATGKAVNLRRFANGDYLGLHGIDDHIDALADAIDVTPGYRVEWEVIESYYG